LQGFEVILFLSPFLADSPAKAIKPALIGAGAILFISFMQTVISIGIMGVDNIQSSIWPGIGTISVIELPGFPVERYELFLTIPWMVGVFTTISLYIYLLAYGITEIFNLAKHRKTITYIASVTLVPVIYIFPTYSWALKVDGYICSVSVLFLFALPLGTLILAVLRGKRGAGNA
jgi:spore germination protein